MGQKSEKNQDSTMLVPDTTEQVKEAFTLIWKIENFSMKLSEDLLFFKDLAKSPSFCLSYSVCGETFNEDFHLIMRLITRESGEGYDKSVTATLHKTTASLTSFNYTVSLVRIDGIEVIRSGVYNKLDKCTKEELKTMQYLLAMKDVYLPEDTLTLQCRIWAVEAERPVNKVKCVARSMFPVSTYTFDIKVPCRDSKCLKVFQKVIPIFKHCPNFEVSICWNKCELCMFCEPEFSTAVVPIVYKLYLKTFSGDLHYLAKRFVYYSQRLALRNSIQLNKSQIEMIKMIPGDVTLHFDIFLYNAKTRYISTIERYCEGDDELCLHHETTVTSLLMLSDETLRTSPTETNSLRQDLNRLHSEQKLCDFTLQVAGTSFPVHTAILAARSSVFASMFEVDMREKKSKMAEVPDVDSDTMERFLQYLYCDTLQDLSTESACTLYFAADKYQVESLKTLCSTFLKSSLSVQTVCQVLTLADMHQDEELMAGCKEFIFSRAKEVFMSDQWTSLNKENLQLSSEVMREAFSKLL